MSTSTSGAQATSIPALLGLALALLSVGLWLFTGLPALPVAGLALVLAYLGLCDTDPGPGRFRGRPLAVAGLVVVLTAVPLFVIIVPSCQMVNEAARSGMAHNDLKQLALAMHNYQDVQGTLPPRAVFDKGGRPLLSWRVLLLPYIEQDDLYKQFKLDEPWDGPHNRKLLEMMPVTYAHPLRRAGEEPFSTHWQVFVGKGAAFEGERGLRLPQDFPDGASQTILIAEAAEAVPWTKPDDLIYAPDKPLPKLGGLFSGSFFVAFGDASVQRLTQETSEATLRALITRNGHDRPGPDWDQ